MPIANFALANCPQDLGNMKMPCVDCESRSVATGLGTSLFGLAKALSILRQNDAAITAYRSALAIDESDATAHFEVARLLEARGNASEAVNHYEAASRHAPNWQDPYLYRGALHEARGEYDESAAAYDQGLKQGAPAGFALRRDLQMPIVAQSTKQYADARTSFVATLDRYVGDPPQIKDPIREAGGNRFYGVPRFGRPTDPRKDGEIFFGPRARHCVGKRRIVLQNVP